jgi:hypothetical protein
VEGLRIVRASHTLLLPLLPLLAALAGCVASYQQPEATAPHADATLTWSSIPGRMYGGYQVFSTLREKCDKEVTQVGVVGISMPNEKRVRLPASKPITLQGVGKGSSVSAADSFKCGTVTCINQWTCESIVSFTPESGKAYVLKLVSDGRACRTEVLDAATGTPPATLTRYSQDDLACRRKP